MVVLTGVEILKTNVIMIRPPCCVICGAPAGWTEITAGALCADGTQAHACTAHLRDRRRWITAWAAFETEQRHIRNRQEHAR